MPRDYMDDLVGRATAADEYFGLALAATRDAGVWLNISPQDGLESRRVIADRAMAEVSGLCSVIRNMLWWTSLRELISTEQTTTSIERTTIDADRPRRMFSALTQIIDRGHAPRRIRGPSLRYCVFTPSDLPARSR